jgi:hypothetical protein
MKISDQTNPFAATNLEGGGKISIGTTAIPINFTTMIPTTIFITADSGNTGVLYLGGPTVDSTGNNAFTYINAGDMISLDYNNISNQLFIVANTSSQNFWKGGFR